MAQEYYVFDTEQKAIDAEAFISRQAGYPLAGINSKTGLVDNTAQKTERWAVPRQRDLDGKWIFPVVPIDIILGLMSIGEAQVLIAQYQNDYPHTKETYQENWFDGIED